MGFLGVYKAVFDYVPQGESELAITEGDILFVIEKSGEDDWWRAKKKASGEDEDEPVGLVPNNYVEEAQPTHHARALYDYTRQTDEELSFTEDAQLEVFDISDPDWILVGLDKEYGFAPANYIELNDAVAETSPSEPPLPSLPRRPPQPEIEDEPVASPVSPQSPAQPSVEAALAGALSQRKISGPSSRAPPPQFTPEASDDDEGPPPAKPARPMSQEAPTPRADAYSSRSPVEDSGPRASPPYNRASFHHRSIDDEVANHAPGGFHMYNINEMVSVMGKRKKMPTTLGVNLATGVILIAPEKGPEQQWTAEKMTHYSIEGKHVFLELVRPSKSIDFHAGAKDTAHEIVGALGELSGAVRAEGLRDIIMAGSGSNSKKGQVLYDFMAQGDDEVTVAVGDEVIIIDDTKSEEWWQVRRIRNGKEGVVPSSYVEITGTIATPSSSGINAGRSMIEQNRLEEERLAKDSLKAARREEEPRGSQVVPDRGSSLSARDSNYQQRSRSEQANNGQGKSSKTRPDPAKTRTWTDRSKSFSVEAQFLALKDGKINLHKTNGVKIAVPVVKMSVEDLEYVERMTGISLDEDKPLSDIRKQQRSRAAGNARGPSPSTAGVTIEKPPGKPEYDWFEFFLSCDVSVGLCQKYAQSFQKDSMDESVLPDIDSTVLRTLGLREGDIIKVMRLLDKKYGRTGAKRGVSFGGEEVIDESSGGLFSGPGGTLKNNTRKGRPAPAIQTNDVVDADAFKHGTKSPEGVATPLASMPAPAQKDVLRSGFDDDAWDVKPSKSPAQPTPAPAPAPHVTQSAPPPAPAVPALTGGMQELSLLTQPLEPVKAQPTAPQQPQIVTPAQQSQPPQGATPSFFDGIGNQQTGLPQQQTPSFNPGINSGISAPRQRPVPQQQLQSQSNLMLPPPPSRPLSAPQANNQSPFPLPPLQPQSTGFQNSSGYQTQVAPQGQSLNDLRMQQQYTSFQGQQTPQQNMGMMNQQQPQNFHQFNGMQQNGMQPNGFQGQNGFQYPQQTGMPQQNFMNNGSPFADPRPNQFSPIQPQPTGFQSSFPQQQFPQATGVNAFLPPPLQPNPTGAQSSFQPGFTAPPMPPMPPQQTSVQALVPQKTGPPPPVRFGVTGDTKKLMPQATGRRANLSQATPQNPFGF